MPRTIDIELGGRLMLMLKGDNGVGKTVAAASFPGPIKFFMFDGSKLDAVKAFYPKRADIEYDIYGPRRMSVKDPFGNPIVIKDLIEFADEFNKLQDYCPWATVVIDSFTSFSVTCVTFQLDVRDTGNKGLNKSKGGLVIPDFDEYKGETTLVTQTLDVSKILPCHVIWTAHPLPKLETTGSGNSMKVTKSSSIAAYGAKTAAMAPGYFNEVWHLEAKPNPNPGSGPWRNLHTASLGEHFAKTSLPLPPVIDITMKPTFKEVQKYLEEHKIKLAERAAAAAVPAQGTAQP